MSFGVNCIAALCDEAVWASSEAEWIVRSHSCKNPSCQASCSLFVAEPQLFGPIGVLSGMIASYGGGFSNHLPSIFLEVAFSKGLLSSWFCVKTIRYTSLGERSKVTQNGYNIALGNHAYIIIGLIG